MRRLCRRKPRRENGDIAPEPRQRSRTGLQARGRADTPSGMGAAGASARAPGLARAAAVALYAYLVARTAWIADDAYISFRTIENFVAGDGLRWNLVERVQSFTHPLWLLLLSGAHALGFDLYFVTIAISVALSLVTAFLVGYRLAPSAATGALAVALLGASRSFVDYSTSGLENPLSHILLVALIL